MPSSSSGGVRYSRVGLLAIALLGLVEITLRVVPLYPYDPARRFNYDSSKNGIAPSARQLAEAVDEVRSKARPGDWVLVGDSVLAGAHAELQGAPATILRAELRKVRPGAQVWDLTMPGEDPSTSAALLARLGRPAGVKLFADISTKIIGHQDRTEYFAQLWDEVARWDSDPPELRGALFGLKEGFLADYKPSGTYGDNAAEVRATIWLNTHLAFLSLDHWFRYRFCSKTWTRLPAALLLDSWIPRGAWTYDVTEKETPHQEFKLDLAVQKSVAEWWGTEVPEGSPMWRGALAFLDQVSAWKGSALLSLQSVPFSKVSLFQPEYRAKVEHAYARVKDAAVSRGIAVLEPNTFVDEQDYADADHFRAPGNRKWVEKALQALPL